MLAGTDPITIINSFKSCIFLQTTKKNDYYANTKVQIYIQINNGMRWQTEHAYTHRGDPFRYRSHTKWQIKLGAARTIVRFSLAFQ